MQMLKHYTNFGAQDLVSRRDAVNERRFGTQRDMEAEG